MKNSVSKGAQNQTETTRDLLALGSAEGARCQRSAEHRRGKPLRAGTPGRKKGFCPEGGGACFCAWVGEGGAALQSQSCEGGWKPRLCRRASLLATCYWPLCRPCGNCSGHCSSHCPGHCPSHCSDRLSGHARSSKTSRALADVRLLLKERPRRTKVAPWRWTRSACRRSATAWSQKCTVSASSWPGCQNHRPLSSTEADRVICEVLQAVQKHVAIA